MEFIDNLAARLAQERATTAAALESARQTLEASRQNIRQELQDKGIPTREDVNITEAAAALASVKAGEKVAGQSSGFIGGVRKTVGGAVSGLGITLFAGEQIARHPVDTARTIASPEGRQNITEETKAQLSAQVSQFREAPLSEKLGIAAGFGLMAKGPRLVKGAGDVGRAGAGLARVTKVSREGIVAGGEKVTPSQVAARITAAIKSKSSTPEPTTTINAAKPKTITEAISFSEKARGGEGAIKRIETLEVGTTPGTALERQPPLGTKRYLNPFEEGRAFNIETRQRSYDLGTKRLTERSQPSELITTKKGITFQGQEKTLEPGPKRIGSILQPKEVRDFQGYKETIRSYPSKAPGTINLLGETTRPKGRFMDLVLSEKATVPRSQELIQPGSELLRHGPASDILDLTYITDKPRRATILERYQSETRPRASDLIQPSRLTPLERGYKFTFTEPARSYRGLLDIGRPSLRMAGLSTFGLLDLKARTTQKQESILETSQRQEQAQVPILETSQRQAQEQRPILETTQKQDVAPILETTQKQDLLKSIPLLGLGFKTIRAPPPGGTPPTPFIQEPRKGKGLPLIPGGGKDGGGFSFGGSARAKKVKDLVTLDISLDLGGSKGFDFGPPKKGGKKGRGFF